MHHHHVNGTARGAIAVPADVPCDPQALARRAVRQTSGAGVRYHRSEPTRLTRALGVAIVFACAAIVARLVVA